MWLGSQCSFPTFIIYWGLLKSQLFIMQHGRVGFLKVIFPCCYPPVDDSISVWHWYGGKYHLMLSDSCLAGPNPICNLSGWCKNHDEESSWLGCDWSKTKAQSSKIMKPYTVHTLYTHRIMYTRTVLLKVWCADQLLVHEPSCGKLFHWLILKR